MKEYAGIFLDQNSAFYAGIAVDADITVDGADSAGDVRGYIEHRLQVAGAARALFTPEAAQLIFERSGGIPRRINQICDVSLLTGFSKGASQVDRAVAQEAIESIGGNA